jgi:hypothetical protein
MTMMMKMVMMTVMNMIEDDNESMTTMMTQ